MTFHVGQKVVCIIRSSWGARHDDADPEGRAPQYGDICTVARITSVEDRTYLALEEFRPGDWSFNAHGFRPIVEKKTDISCFTALLNPSPAKETERV